ncbi:PD-(D/E)XK nuclease family protein [Streptomyces sp. NPDC001137]|uniref:PD-(D/E)XK nuclease family protein n=1 Tax=Streptomyces sp. NPDC001137 TaxID=3154378 RepID=UPI0033171BBF
MTSLADALDTFLEMPLDAEQEDDGLPFSPDARVRFARLAAELRDLRRSLADPLMDVLHRVLAVTGLEVELSASPHALAARRRETLSNFLDIAASFAAGDGEATLLAFLGFLRTAAQYEKGLDNALPGGENTVKVLTAHKSKGLEWDVVAVPGLVTGTFPSTQGREKWTAQGKVLPHELRGDADTLPDVDTWDSRGLKAFQEAMKEHQHTEELRLGYVTFTRPRSLLLGSGHWWGPTQKKPRGPSDFLQALHDHCAAGYGEIEAWADEPAEGEENPALHAATADQVWPLPLDEASLARRRTAAETVLAHLEDLASHEGGAATHDPDSHDDPEWPPPPDDEDLPHEEGDPFAEEDPFAHENPADWDAWSTDRPTVPHQAAAPEGTGNQDARPHPAPRKSAAERPRAAAPTRLTPEEARTLASWDRDLDALTGELLRAREAVTDVPLPASLTASQVLRLATDPDGFAQELARPMPRPPQPAARRGTRFHAWVEARFEELTLPMLEPEDLPGSETEIADERDLEALKDAFERTEYAHRTPHRVEAPFQLAIAGRVVRGRIDAVYKDDDGDGTTYEIVDWKTSRSRTADPLQLALYRLAWAEQQGVPLESVNAAFLYVRTGEVVRPEDLPDRSALERLLLDEPAAEANCEEPPTEDVGAGR